MVDLAADPGTARTALDTLWRIRVFEEAVDELFARGLMHGTMHLSIGQEASAVGGVSAVVGLLVGGLGLVALLLGIVTVVAGVAGAVAGRKLVGAE